MLSHSPTTEVFEFRLEPDHCAASEVRNRLRDQLDVSGVERQMRADVELVASELLANAVDQDSGDPVEILLIINAQNLYLTVTNGRSDGTVCTLGAQPSSASVVAGQDAPLRERGWGLAIVHTIADGMWVHETRTSTSVSCLHNRHR